MKCSAVVIEKNEIEAARLDSLAVGRFAGFEGKVALGYIVRDADIRASFAERLQKGPYRVCSTGPLMQ